MKHSNVLIPQESASSPKPIHACIILYIVTLYEQRAADKIFCKISKYIICTNCQLAVKVCRTDQCQCLHCAYELVMLVSECISQSVSQSVRPSELVQKSHEHTTVQSIDCNHVQLWYIVVYYYV